MTAPDPAMLGAMASPAALAGFWLTVDEDGDIILSAPCAETIGCLWYFRAGGERVTLAELNAAAAVHTGEAARKTHDELARLQQAMDADAALENAQLDAAGTPEPAELWHRSGGNRELYARLLREHGHILAPGDEGYGDGMRWPDCGWKPEGAAP